MSKYIAENSLNPVEARDRKLETGAGEIRINYNNGAIEVTHSDGSVLMQAKNVSEGTIHRLWILLECCGEMDFRA